MGPRPGRLAQSATDRCSDQQRLRAQDRPTRYPHFYADISALTLPNRLHMLRHLRRYPEIHERLLFDTDYPLSVFHVAAWGRVGFGALRDMIRTKNRFDRQVEVRSGLGLNFQSLGNLLG